jgi:hypothetical protein
MGRHYSYIAKTKASHWRERQRDELAGNRDASAYGHPIRSMRKAASNVELTPRRCDRQKRWKRPAMRHGAGSGWRAQNPVARSPPGAAPGRMSGGELTTVATIDGGDFLFSLGSAGRRRRGVALVAARTTIRPAYALDRRPSASPTPRHPSTTHEVKGG